MRTFLEVQNTRHFGRAAENLYLTQSAVSFRIRQLELQLGVKLFDRNRNNIQLTSAGKRLVPHAQAILEGWRQAIQEVGLEENQQLRLTLGAPPGVWAAYLQERLTLTARQQPGLTVRAEAKDSLALCRDLQNRDLDLVVLIEPPRSDEFIAEPLGQLNLVLVANRAEQDLALVGETGYVRLDWGSGFAAQEATLFSQRLIPALETNQCAIALDYILKVGGSAYLPETLVASYLGQRLFRVTHAPLIECKLYALKRRESGHSLALESMLAQLKQSPCAS
nr:LysR family transcriptional regulator [Motiliproteus sp. SC1-56]